MPATDLTSPERITALSDDFLRDGFVLLEGCLGDDLVDRLDAEMIGLQDAVAAGTIDRAYYGGDYLTSAVPGEPAPFVHYVNDVMALSPAAAEVVASPVLGQVLARSFDTDAYWQFDTEHADRLGFVYQDCRSGRESGYSRIGWHTDHQAYPNSDFWPGIAITVHLDATSPANGFLRVVPGSHRWSTDDLPLGFEKIRGEIPVYAERGDVILHHSDLWHSAARATEDAPDGIRRHVRGSFYAGRKPAPGEEIEAFNKNARR